MPTPSDKQNKDGSKPKGPRRKSNKPIMSADLDIFINAFRDEQRANREQADRETRSKGLLDKWTLGFVIATTIGIFIQACILNNSDRAIHDSAKAAIDSAKAAKQSADSVAGIERPYLFVTAQPSQNVSRDGPFPAPDKTPTVTYSITDIGRVPAIIRAMYVDCFVDMAPPLPPRFMHEKIRPSLIAVGTNNIASNPDFSCTFDLQFTAFEWEALKNGTKSIYFVTGLVYEGALSATYVDRSIFRIDPFNGKAFPVNVPGYNYNRTIQGRMSEGISVPVATLFN